MRHFRYLIAAVLACCIHSFAQAQTTDEPETEPATGDEPQVVKATGTLPVVHIDTDDGAPITNTEDYIGAQYYIEGCGDLEGVATPDSTARLEIRGRGHASWKGDKKPYKLKLDKKTPLLGMPKSKHWALIKPSENTIAGFELGRLLQMAWTPRLQPVEVVLNGDYIGLYFLTETVRIAKERVNIYEQADGETDPDLIPGGWLVEIDNYSDDNQIVIPENSQWILRVKYHSPEELSPEQKSWLKKEFVAINKAIYSDDKASTEWEQYIDVESMARFFILQEVMDNPDGFHGSFYLHKDLGDNAKWIAGPIWDMNCYNRQKTDYTFRMEVNYTITPHWIGELIQYSSFCQAVSMAWEEVRDTGLPTIYEYIDEHVLPLAEAWAADNERWGGSETASAKAERIKTALERNIEWFDSNLPKASTASDIIIEDPEAQCEVYNLQGIRLGYFPSIEAAKSALPGGVYIVNHRKIAIGK